MAMTTDYQTTEDGIEWLRWCDAHDLPPLDFVLPGLLAGTVGMCVGPGGIGKSMLAMAIGAGVSLGEPIAGGPAGAALFDAPKRGAVAIVFGEDPKPIVQHRQDAFLKGLRHEQAAALDGTEGLGIVSWHGRDMRVLDTTVRPYADGPWLGKLREIAVGKRLVIVDPLGFLHAGDESDNGAMTLLMQILSRVARETGAAILVLHHVRKPGGDDRDDWSRARGASSLTTSVRVQYDMRGLTEAEAQAFGVPEDQRWWWCRFATVKINYDRPRAPVWLQRGGEGGMLQCADPHATPSERSAARRTVAAPPMAGEWEDME